FAMPLEYKFTFLNKTLSEPNLSEISIRTKEEEEEEEEEQEEEEEIEEKEIEEEEDDDFALQELQKLSYKPIPLTSQWRNVETDGLTGASHNPWVYVQARELQLEVQIFVALETMTFSTKTSWFENQELSDAETSWITLLRTVDPHLNRSNLEKFVSFPEFHPKNSQIANPQPCLETFNCGTKTFEWVPLPVYRGDWKAADSGRHQNSTPEKIIPAGENDPEEARKAISLVPKQKSQTAKGYKVGDTKGGIKYSIQLEDEGFEMR
ncbi:hypothetical protein E2320_006209, partial [Naja naja]